jgi:hypothetical protein
MHIELRSTDRLKSSDDVDLGRVFATLATLLKNAQVDPARLRVVCDWVQYRRSFREPVDLRAILAAPGCDTADAYEIALDLRRTEDLAARMDQALAGGAAERIYLEDWCSGQQSCIWAFNSLYWNYLGLWEETTGRQYEQALPRGESDARNTEAAGAIIEELFRVLDQLSARRALPEDLHILELGVGNGNQAKVWLDEFQRRDRERGSEYYRRLHYLMGDYSSHVLERARKNVQHHGEHVSSLVLDARSPSTTLGFLRFKAFLIYISNVYDNLPSDEVVRIGGHLYRVETRAYLAAPVAPGHADGVPELVRRLIQLGPELLAGSAPQQFSNAMTAAGFWRDVWDGLRLEERYVPLEDLDTYEIAPEVSGEVLRPIVEADGDLRMHVSNGAASSFLGSLPLLHPFGALYCHDLFVTKLDQYASAFRGPGKYDGSVVNWVNGPLLAAIGRRHGFDVEFTPFAHRSGSNITTLTARVRE